ncbi:MAG: hypothetical protein MUO41_13345, partial [Methyloceanibacter sp.]|nr:hypothetical protein [Methyloceanibacter sp.]
EGIAHRRRLRILARRLKPIYSDNAVRAVSFAVCDRKFPVPYAGNSSFNSASNEPGMISSALSLIIADKGQGYGFCTDHEETVDAR